MGVGIVGSPLLHPGVDPMAEETKRDGDDVEKWVRQRIDQFITWLNSQDIATRIQLARSMGEYMEQVQNQLPDIDR
jgi:glutamyl-tRNA reductase